MSVFVKTKPDSGRQLWSKTDRSRVGPILSRTGFPRYLATETSDCVTCPPERSFFDRTAQQIDHDVGRLRAHDLQGIDFPLLAFSELAFYLLDAFSEELELVF